MVGTIKIDATTLKPKDTANEQVTKTGLTYTTKSVLGHMVMQEYKRLVINHKTFIVYRFVFLASGNMYMDIYSMTDETGVEVASAVVAHMYMPLDRATKTMGDRAAHMSYSQNRYDTKMLDICLDDITKLSFMEEALNGESFSVLLRLHSSIKGCGRVLAIVIANETLRFRTQPNRLWIEPCGYDADLVDTHLGIVVELEGDDDKLIAYYTSLGFSWINTSDWKEAFYNNFYMRNSILGYIDLRNSTLMEAMSNNLRSLAVKNKRTTYTKHISVERRKVMIGLAED